MLRISVVRSLRTSSSIRVRIWARNASNFSAAVGTWSGSEGFDGFDGDGSRRGGGGSGSRIAGGGGGIGSGSTLGGGFGRSMTSGVDGFSGGGGGGGPPLCVAAKISTRSATPPTPAMIGSGLEAAGPAGGRRGGGPTIGTRSVAFFRAGGCAGTLPEELRFGGSSPSLNGRHSVQKGRLSTSRALPRSKSSSRRLLPHPSQ